MNGKWHSVFVLLVSSLCSLCLCGESFAALDPEVKKPYDLHVVLRVAPHRLLTRVFKDQLSRELRDSLQATLGKMGNVDVTDDQPSLKDIESRGLQQTLDGLDRTAAGRKPVKTHFVLVDYVDGQYEIRTAQHDGLTGLTTPVVRLARTPDPSGRPFVARIAARLVDRDFGIVGTATKIDGAKVEVTLKGSQLGEPLDRWVGKDDVFAIARLTRSGSGEQATRLDDSLLQVVEPPRNGVCVCRMFNRYQDAKLTEGPGVLGYRCLKLGTSAEPVSLQLRLVDAKGIPQDGLQIEVGKYGFDKNDEFKYQGTTRDGVLQTEEKFRHIAFVRVQNKGTLIAQIPVPVFEERTVVCKVNVSDQGGVLGLLNLRKRTCLQRLTETLLVQDDLRKELGELMSKGQLDATVAKAREGLKGLDADIADLSAEVNNLSVAARELPPTARFQLRDAEQRLAELRTARAELHKHVGELEEAVAKLQKDTRRKELETLVQLARNQRRQANVNEALKTYQEALDRYGPNTLLQKEMNDLKDAWQTKSAEHAAARKFIYQVWPAQDFPRKLRDRLDEARKAFEVCKQAGDKLTVEKLYLVNNAHAGRLERQFNALRPESNEDDRRMVEVIEKVAGDMQKLHQEVCDFLGIKQGPAPAPEKK